MNRRNFCKKTLLAVAALSLLPVLSACNSKPKSLKLILFDLSGSVHKCSDTWLANKAKAQAVANTCNSGDILLLVTFRSKGQPRDETIQFRSTKGPQNSYLKEDQKEAAKLIGQILDDEVAVVTNDKATDLVGGLASTFLKIEEARQNSPDLKVELSVMSDGVHTRGRRLSGRFTPANYSLYIELVREVVGQSSLPKDVKISRVDWYGKDTCGIQELDHQAITCLQRAIEDLWRNYFSKNVLASNFVFHRSY